ncbi:hypothetical protein EOD41_00140 [Mucilaginibacter limnophilus]|uniref:Uncharacterized protein n=1 Tax=Mucilaginibacter limnophilus TaxID=1932778 RepID=A0A3S2Y594_9SPHI|nr:hypothetical protein [Mucilaginibacter limnophilus]RVU02386.1 hypothetical protein EOD41_00140 [Mucilaginibacter limnophilus]
MAKSICIVIVMLCLCLTACQPKLKFDKAKWNSRSDMEYPYRDAMLDDLLKQHHLKGLTYKELTKNIGEPIRALDNLEYAYYNIVTDYGSDIDPVYTKILSIKLNKDSIVTDYKVEEWKKD